MPYCCVNCFNDKTLKDYITQSGEIGDCDFCGSQNVSCIEPSDLEELFLPLVLLYDYVEDFMPLEDLKEWDGQFIWEKLNEDWDTFAFYDYAKQKELMEAIFARSANPKEGGFQHLHSYVVRQGEYWGDEDEVSDKLGKDWDSFCNEIKFNSRYFPTKAIDTELLGELLPYFEHMIEAEAILFRSRISEQGVSLPCSEMGKPPINQSQHGRANPKGIPYLYLSSDSNTAIAEIKPFSGDKITVAEFLVKEPIRTVDLRNPRIDDPFRFGGNLEFMCTYLKFIRRLGTELSKTVSPREAELEYIPLQYLCEFIKRMGFDGVLYESSVADGYNVAIFDDSKLQCANTTLHLVGKVNYQTFAS
jgi:hypothetical protein